MTTDQSGTDHVQLIKEAALKEGFAIEWEVCQTLKGLQYDVTQGAYLPHTDDPDLEVEIDIQALGSKNLIVCECKGAPSESILLGVQSQNTGSHRPKIPKIIQSKDTIELNRDLNIACNMRDSHPIYCHNADFFNYKKPGNNQPSYTKASKQDDKSNFFKGKVQLINAVSASISSNTHVDYVFVIPMIVTNASLHAIKYSDNNGSITQKIANVPWLIFENEIKYGATDLAHQLTWTSSGLNSAPDPAPAYLPYFFVVNKNNLSEFIEAYAGKSLQYSTATEWK